MATEIDTSKAKQLAQFLENWGRNTMFPQQQFIEAANLMRGLIEFYEDFSDHDSRKES